MIAVYKLFIHLRFSDCDDPKSVPHNSSTESKTKKQLFEDLQVDIHSSRHQHFKFCKIVCINISGVNELTLVTKVHFLIVKHPRSKKKRRIGRKIPTSVKQ